VSAYDATNAERTDSPSRDPIRTSADADAVELVCHLCERPMLLADGRASTTAVAVSLGRWTGGHGGGTAAADLGRAALPWLEEVAGGGRFDDPPHVLT